MSVKELITPLIGARVAGGCDACDAYQVVEQVEEGIYAFGIFHDDNCRTLALHELRRQTKN